MKKPTLERLFWIVVLIGVGLYLHRVWPVQDALELVRVAGRRGEVAFLATASLAGMLMVPGTALAVLAGAIFPDGRAFLLASLALTLSAGLAFLVARYLVRDRVRRWGQRRRIFRALDRAVAEDGWKILALVRLCPVLPFSLENYFFGITNLSFPVFLGVSWLALLPGTCVWVYTGQLGAGERRPENWTPFVLGLLFSLTALAWVGRKIKRQLDREEALRGPAGPPWGLRACGTAALVAALITHWVQM